MKRLFTIVAGAIMVGSSAVFAIDWTSGKVENLAKGASVTVSSNSGTEALIVDDNNGTGWQASAATHAKTQDWVLIDLGEKKTFTNLEIVWEASHCKKYSVYVTNEAVESNAVEEDGLAYRTIDESWLAGHEAAATGGNDTEANYTENITFENVQAGRYVLVYANEYNNFGANYGMRIFEIRLANIEGQDEFSEIKFSQEGNAMANGDAATVTVTLLNKVGGVIEADADIRLTCDDESVVIAKKEDATNVFTVSATTSGSYTLKAEATVGEITLTATYDLSVAYNWSGVENIAANKDIQGRLNANTEQYPVNNPVANAIDGNLETCYQYNGEWGGGDSWLVVDLGDEYMVEAIGAAYGETSNGKCVFGYATDATAILNKIDADGTDFRWTDFTENTGWEETNQLERSSNATVTYEYAAPVVARYILVRDADNPQGRPCVNEIYVKGEVRSTPVATAIELSASDNYVVTGTEVALTAVVKDQYGAEMTGETVSFSCDDEGVTLANNVFTASKVGDYTVKATSGEELSAEIVVSVVAEKGFLFTAETEPVKHTVKVGGVEQTANSFLGAELQIANDLPVTLEYEFEKPYSFSLLNLRWEAACPEAYGLTVTYADETTAAVQVVSGRKFDGANHTDKIVNAIASNARALDTDVAMISLENVKKLSFEITAKDHNYALRLFGIDAYGVEAPGEPEAPAVPMDITMYLDQADYGTMILPFEAEIPESMEVYGVSGYEEATSDYSVLALTPVNTIEANTPYIMKRSGEQVVFNFHGEAKAGDENTYTSGWLTGVLTETIAPQNSYVLQDQNGRLGFYYVESDDIKVGAYHAYLTPSTDKEIKAFVFDINDVDGIHSLATSQALVNVYNVNGVLVRKAVKACDALNGLQGGIYIVNGVKQVVK